jgi:flagellar hook-associated protein 3 FlgL
MAAIYPVTTNRSSELLSQTRLVTQIAGDQLDILRLQSQISTGRRVTAPSEDSSAATRAMSLQRLLELKAQAKVNLNTSQSYLDATDVAVSGVSTLLTQLRSTAMSVADTISTESSRRAVVEEIQRGINQLLDVGNQNFRGRYLFAGARTTIPPFEVSGEQVLYKGNAAELRSYADVDLLFATNLPGSSLLGAYSAQVEGTVDLNPIVTRDTLLVDLRQGRGIAKGSIALSDGTSTRTIDLSRAETLGDVADLIEAGAPAGRTIRARVTSVGLQISLADGLPGNLAINEVGSGTTAAELGILNVNGVGTAPIIGAELDPVLRRTTRLDDLLGSRSTAVLESVGLDNDILLRARTNGSATNGVAIQFVDDRLMHASPGLVAGAETVTYTDVPLAARAAVSFSGFGNNLILTATQAGTAFNNVSIQVVNAGAIGNAAQVSYNATTQTLTIGVDSANSTQVQTVVNAINAEGTFTAAHDPSDPVDGPYVPTATVQVSDAGNVSGNTSNSGAAARTALVYIQSGGTTAAQVVSALQNNATFNSMFEVSLDTDDVNFTGAGSNLVDVNARAVTALGSGQDFDRTSGLQIVNGKTTHTIDFSTAQTLEDLLNTLNGSSAAVLAEINESGRGIRIRSRLSGADFSIGENGGQTATQLGVRSLTNQTYLAQMNYGRGISQSAGVDFTIRRNDGVTFDIDIAGAETLGDVLNLINNHPGNGPPGSGVVARLSAFGNGIELIDDNPVGTGTLAVLKTFGSDAAIDLGLVQRGQTQSTPATPALAATASLTFAAPHHLNTGINVTAGQAGTGLDGVEIVFQNTLVGDTATASYDSTLRRLTVSLDAAATTANTVVAAIQAEGTFAATLNTTADPTNNGTGVIGTVGTVGTTSGGRAEVFTGADRNPQEVHGVFNTLLRLKDAVQNFDLPAMSRAIELLDMDLERINFGRAEVGARGRALDTLRARIDDEEVQLKATLSQEIDVDFTEAVSALAARQASLEASLRLTAQVFQLSLLRYL